MAGPDAAGDTRRLFLPQPTTMGLFSAYLASAAVAIAAALSLIAPAGLFWLAKPLTTALVIATALRRGRGQPVALRRAVAAGLMLSWLGDVALMFPGGFLAGLVAFLLAHLAYLVAFTSGGVRLAARPAPFVFYAMLAAAVLWRLWPDLPVALRGPVLAYVLCLAAMAAQAATRWQVLRERGDDALAHRAALGGLLFMSSDALLAIDRFHAKLPLAPLWILASYWAAQWAIAMALTPRRP